MKKRRLKRWVKKLIIVLIVYSIGIGCVLALSYNAERIDRMEMNYNEIN